MDKPIVVLPRKTPTATNAKITNSATNPSGNIFGSLASSIGNIAKKASEAKKNIVGGVASAVSNIGTKSNNNVVSNEQSSNINYGQEAVNNISDYLKNMQNTYDKNMQDTQSLFESKKESDLAALRNAIAKQKSNYQGQLAQSNQQFQPARDSVDVNRAKSLQRIRELQGSQGIFGGDNITAQTDINTGADSSIGGLNQSQANYESEIQRSISDLENAQTEQERQIITQNLADQIQATINARNNLMNNQTNANSQLLSAYGIAQGGQQFGQQMDFNRYNADRGFDINVAGLTGEYQGNQTLQGRQADMQLQSQNLDNISRQLGITKEHYLLSVLPEQIENKLTMEEQAIAANDISNQLNQYNLDFLQPMELQRLQSAIASQDASTAYQVIQNSYAPQMLKEQIASSLASRNLAQVNADRNQANTDRDFFARYEDDGQGGYKMRESASTNNQSNIINQLVKEGYDRLNSTVKNEFGVDTLRYRPEQLTNWVLNLPITDEQKVELGNRLGLPSPKNTTLKFVGTPNFNTFGR